MRRFIPFVFAALLAASLSRAGKPPTGSAPAGPTHAASRDVTGNKVEPLSNGLRLSMTQAEIQQAFGPPTDTTWDQRSFGYASFFVACGGAHGAIWHLTLKSGVRLHSGVGVGSPRAEVVKIFGRADTVRYGQYRLTFSYATGDVVRQIKIDPADGEFADFRRSKPAPKSDAKTDAITASGAAGVVGTWWCVMPSWSSGTIEIRADGTYTRPEGVSGRYLVENGNLIFDGNLKAWNNGHAKLENGNLVFEWTNADGSHNYFAFRKG